MQNFYHEQPRAHGEIEKFLQDHSQTAFERYLEVKSLREKHPTMTIQQAFSHIYPKDAHTLHYLSAINLINARLLAGNTIEDLQKLYPPQLEQTKISAIVEEQRSQTATRVKGIKVGQPSPEIPVISGNIEEAKQAKQKDSDDFEDAQDIVDKINQFN